MIKKMFLAIIALAVMALGLVGVSTSASAVAPAAVVAGDQAPATQKSVKLTASANIKFKRTVRCASRASKHEEEAPPADPSASCLNKLKGKRFVATAFQKCLPPAKGYAKATASVSQYVVAKAVSKSMAPRVKVAVMTEIVDRIFAKTKVSITCFKPDEPTPPREMITVCDLATKQIVTIYAEEFSPARYSKNLADCNYVPEVPSVAIFGSPAHLYVNGDIWVYAEASPANATIAFSATGAGWVSGATPVSYRWDGSSCPSGKTCWKVHAWAGPNPGTMTVTAVASSGGKQSVPASVSWPVLPDNFG